MQTDNTLSHQWATRPDDERFTSIPALRAFVDYQKAHSKALKLANREISVVPSTTDKFDVALTGPNGHPVSFTHWSFGQLASLAGVPTGYARSGLPAPLLADCLNWGLHHARPVEYLGVLLRKPQNGGPELAAATGPDYGRIWNADILRVLNEEYGDGVSGDWRIPGEFGKSVAPTKANTTLYGSDRDIWAFLADETNRVEMPDRRSGKPGSFARGFYIGNSEVGASTIVLGMFLFDYACCNRILWGVGERQQIKIRHIKGAPFRWLEEIKPVLHQLARKDVQADTIAATLRAARETKIQGDVETFLANRFGKNSAVPILNAHRLEEFRPIETIFDAVTGATAWARSISHQDTRTAVEAEAGNLLYRLPTPATRTLVPVLR